MFCLPPSFYDTDSDKHWEGRNGDDPVKRNENRQEKYHSQDRDNDSHSILLDDFERG
jgi:hypothetical protein